MLPPSRYLGLRETTEREAVVSQIVIRGRRLLSPSWCCGRNINRVRGAQTNEANGADVLPCRLSFLIAIIEAVDQMEIARTAASGTDRNLPVNCFCAGGKRCSFFVSDRRPL